MSKTKLNKYEKILIVVIILYAILSFINLGNMISPQTHVNLKKDEYVIYKLEENKVPCEFLYFIVDKDIDIGIYLAEEYNGLDSDFIADTFLTTDYTFALAWNKISINNIGINPKYIKVISFSDDTNLGEIAFLDENGEVIKTSVVKGTEMLSDEVVYLYRDFMNSAYFDEQYYARAAYEIYNQKYIFEFVHPPLGKILIGIPMLFIGFTPFSWRLMNNLVGIFMIFVMYYIAKELFEDDKYALFAAIILSLDGMHFVQTRVGMIESFWVFFSLLSILFFIKYLKEKLNKKKSYVYFTLSGLMWGCAISTKWLAAFVGAGLAILFIIDYFKNKKIIVDKKFNYMPIFIGLVSFVFIPIAIYLLSYLPIYGNENEFGLYYGIDEEGNRVPKMASPNSVKGFFMYQYAMYNYHSTLGTADDFEPNKSASKWYTWPLIYKPMLSYSLRYQDNCRSAIVEVGNIVIWWI